MTAITQQATNGTVTLFTETASVVIALRGEDKVTLPVSEIVEVKFKDHPGFRKNWARLSTMTGSAWEWRTWEPTAAFAHLVMLLAKWGRNAQESAVAEDMMREELRDFREILEKYRRDEL